MAARICPQCRTRVDERRAKASPYCLSCGAPLGSGLGHSPHKPVAKSPLPWILGGASAFVVLALGFGACLFVIASPAPQTAATSNTETNNVPNIETPTAQPIVTAVPTVPTGKVPAHPTATVAATATASAPKVLGAFPRAQANNDLDRVTAGLGSCKRSGDPSGSGSIRVDFEPDGRVGTVIAKPFAGTATGSCITSRYLAIRVGAFQGTVQSITRTFSITGSNAPGF